MLAFYLYRSTPEDLWRANHSYDKNVVEMLCAKPTEFTPRGHHVTCVRSWSQLRSGLWTLTLRLVCMHDSHGFRFAERCEDPPSCVLTHRTPFQTWRHTPTCMLPAPLNHPAYTPTRLRSAGGGV